MTGAGGGARPRPPLSLSEMCRKYGIRFKKGLGQNLLLDDNINRILIDAADLANTDQVFEVGAGLGALTRRLAHRAGRVLAIEIDASFMPCLEEQFAGNPAVRLFRGDVLNHELSDLAAQFLDPAPSYKMVSNLPYYITTPVLFHFFDSALFFSRIVVMVQAEVASRLAAPVGGADYGVLTLAAQAVSHVDIVHRVPASCFVPRPKVDSSIVRFRCFAPGESSRVDRNRIMRVVRAAFSQRRKTLRNALAVLGLSKEELARGLEAAGIGGDRRPQTLTLAEYKRLAEHIG